ncbi:MAG: hypothetical protein WD055_01025 [Candidatus Dependentiae bacterium]
MNICSILFLSVLCNTVCAQDGFDLKIISRDQKREVPWSLDGFAQNLRSDAKHALQQIMDSFTLLWPEAAWNDNQKPSVATIEQAFADLTAYIQQEGNPDRIDQIKKSIDYIILSYVPVVQKKIADGAPSIKNPYLDEKKQLLDLFEQALKQKRKSFDSFLNV